MKLCLSETESAVTENLVDRAESHVDVVASGIVGDGRKEGDEEEELGDLVFDLAELSTLVEAGGCGSVLDLHIAVSALIKRSTLPRSKR